MKLQSFQYADLPYSSLVADYITSFENLADCYSGNPFSDDQVRDYVDRYAYHGDRTRLFELLKSYNEPFDLHESAKKNLELLKEDDTLVVVTGQQPMVYGGPLMVVNKTMGAILSARRISRLTGRTVVPVFWIGDEDHDFQEMSVLNLPGNPKPDALTVELPGTGYTRVADLRLNGSFAGFSARVKEKLPQTDFSGELWNLLDNSFKDGNGWGDAFGKLMAGLFSKHGLILAGSNDPGIKQFVQPVIVKAIQYSDNIRDSLEKQSKIFEKHQGRQAGVEASLLFYVDEHNVRHRIHRTNGIWEIENERSWTTEALIDLAGKNPERLSPNVFLRPLMQDFLLPNIAYVAGPGELAYFGQMKSLYSIFERPEPFIIPRLSSTLVEPSIARVLDQVPLKWMEFSGRIEDLEKEYLKQSNAPDIDELFNKWNKRFAGLKDELKSEISEIDPTLSGAVDSSSAVFFKEMGKLKGKVTKAVKSDQDIQIKRIHRIQQHLYPDREWQERKIAFIYFMNKYGMDLWDTLLEMLDNDKLDSHKLIFL